jgi:hypothetical protein
MSSKVRTVIHIGLTKLFIALGICVEHGLYKLEVFENSAQKNTSQRTL